FGCDAERDTLIVVDDDLFILDVWQHLEHDLIMTFSSPEKFLNAISNNEISLKRIRAIVVDYYFDGSTTGIDLVRTLQEKGIAAPMFLATNSPNLNIHHETGMTNRLDKDPYTAHKQLHDLLRSEEPHVSRVLTV